MFSSDNEIPDRAAPPRGTGKRAARSTPPPKGKIRLTVNIPKPLHQKLKLESLRERTTVTGLILGAANAIEFHDPGPDGADLSDPPDTGTSTGEGQPAARLTINVPIPLHFKLRTEALARRITLTRLMADIIEKLTER